MSNEANDNSESMSDEELDREIDGNSVGNKRIKELKVKADPPDIDPEEKKRRVKKLAGAISHSLRDSGEVAVRGLGDPCVDKGTKAIAIATRYIKSNDQNLQLECAPAFVEADIGGEKSITGISFNVFATEGVREVDIEGVKSVLMVKADRPDISEEERVKNLHKLAGAINHSLAENHEVVVRSIGPSAIGKAAKALAIARGYTATRGADLYCWPVYIIAQIQGNERTGIAWYAYTNELQVD
jgi:stage V sporulation protein SpoVS